MSITNQDVSITTLVSTGVRERDGTLKRKKNQTTGSISRKYLETCAQLSF